MVVDKDIDVLIRDLCEVEFFFGRCCAEEGAKRFDYCLCLYYTPSVGFFTAGFTSA